MSGLALSYPLLVRVRHEVEHLRGLSIAYPGWGINLN